MKQTPSILRIVQVDYLASLGVILPLAFWGLALVGRFFDPEAASFFRLIAAPATAAASATSIPIAAKSTRAATPCNRTGSPAPWPPARR